MIKHFRFIILCLLLMLFCTIGYSIFLSRTIDSTFQASNNGLLNFKKIPKYHFQVILHNSDEPYVQNIIKGLKETAEACKVALEINYVNDIGALDGTVNLLDMAIASKVDGIITNSYETAQYDELINEADRRKIPIISLSSNTLQSKSGAYVGTNSFEMGVRAGKLTAEATHAKAKVAIIVEDIKNFGNINIEGFKEAIKDYKNMEVKTIQVSNMDILDANNITQEILAKYPDINAIVCTNSKDTIGVAQSIVDLNKVSEISIIGYDSTPEILRYIQKGVIYGTISPNAYSIGSNSIRILMDMKNNGRASSYFDADYSIITAKNLSDFLNKDGEKSEK